MQLPCIKVFKKITYNASCDVVLIFESFPLRIPNERERIKQVRQTVIRFALGFMTDGIYNEGSFINCVVQWH